MKRAAIIVLFLAVFSPLSASANFDALKVIEELLAQTYQMERTLDAIENGLPMPALVLQSLETKESIDVEEYEAPNETNEEESTDLSQILMLIQIKVNEIALILNSLLR